MNEIVQAARGLRKSPALATIAIASLALGIGANVTIYSVVRELIFDDISARQPDRLARIGADIDYGRLQRSSARRSFSRPGFRNRPGRLELDHRNAQRTRLADVRPAPISSTCWASGAPWDALFATRRRPPGGRGELRFLARASQFRSKHHWPRAPVQRPALYRAGRAAARLSQHLRSRHFARIYRLAPHGSPELPCFRAIARRIHARTNPASLDRGSPEYRWSGLRTSDLHPSPDGRASRACRERRRRSALLRLLRDTVRHRAAARGHRLPERRWITAGTRRFTPAGACDSQSPGSQPPSTGAPPARRRICVWWCLGAGAGLIIDALLRNRLSYVRWPSAYNIPFEFHFQNDRGLFLYALAAALTALLVSSLLPSVRGSDADLGLAMKQGEPAFSIRRWNLRNSFVAMQLALSMVLLMLGVCVPPELLPSCHPRSWIRRAAHIDRDRLFNGLSRREWLDLARWSGAALERSSRRDWASLRSGRCRLWGNCRKTRSDEKATRFHPPATPTHVGAGEQFSKVLGIPDPARPRLRNHRPFPATGARLW